jgi:hypothetical protein
MIIAQEKFENLYGNGCFRPISRNTFSPAYIMTDEMNAKMKIPMAFSDMQSNPDILNLNFKYFSVGDTIAFQKIKTLDNVLKRSLSGCIHKYNFEYSLAYFLKNTSKFYGFEQGWSFSNLLFNHKIDYNNQRKTDITDDNKKTMDIVKHFVSPFSLQKGYNVHKDWYNYIDFDDIPINKIMIINNLVLSLYYEWTLVLHEYDNFSFFITINPSILKELHETSLLKFDDKKKMLHFVKDHYRRKSVKNNNEDYSVYIKKYLRGESKCSYRNFSTEIIPPKYDLNRIKTRKKFTEIF